MRRLFISRDRIAGGRAELSADASHYLRDVLRLEAGAELEVFDGEGGRHLARLRGDRSAPFLELGPRQEEQAEHAALHLAFALARGERCDWVVQKATELGVVRLSPFQSDRSVVHLDPERALDRARRWQRIAVEAARQCGRADVPKVDVPTHVPEMLAGLPRSYQKILFYEGGGEPLAELFDRSAPGHVALIGPEGGFAPSEVEACVAAGARLTSLGSRVLRFETAGIVAVALMQHLSGGLG